MLQGLHHLVLFCRDTEASRDWYTRAGFEHLRGHDGMHWFRFGTAEILLHPADGGPGGYVPAIHAAVDDVDAHFRRVVGQGLKPFDHQQEGRSIEAPVTRAWGAREFELVDHDGHRWAFTEA
jgi:catechol 2,3-dioxygenase-like lactoylglutathione lyase family enzyme